MSEVEGKSGTTVNTDGEEWKKTSREGDGQAEGGEERSATAAAAAAVQADDVDDADVKQEKKAEEFGDAKKEVGPDIDAAGNVEKDDGQSIAIKSDQHEDRTTVATPDIDEGKTSAEKEEQALAKDSNKQTEVTLNDVPKAETSSHLSPSTHLSETPNADDRELPAPPTPAKETASLSADDELADVARAFGVQAKIREEEESVVPTSAQQHSPNTAAETTGSIESSAQPPANASAAAVVQPATTGANKTGGLRIGKGPPPTTQASEEKPFDFNRFLDQMRHRSAGPVGEYVRSFIKGFTKKPYRVTDQTKLIFDFLDFISIRMRECEVWASLSQGEFDNSMEAMEKLIMNRLYNFTFSPAIKREGKWSVQTDDLERDRVLKQRIRLFGWIDESHLDVPTGDHSKGFIDFAIQELLKINHYKAPRDKVICILNCCKVIFGLIRHLSTQENADTFVPILIFVVLRANPDNLISNVEYISRFRNPERLSSESGYYLSSLMGAVAFIETMDYTSLSNITQQEFEANVETAIVSISAQGDPIDQLSPVRMESGTGGAGDEGRKFGLGSSFATQQASGSGSAQMTPQGSVSSNEDGTSRALPISTGATALAKDTRAFIARTGEAARVGIGASFGGGMSALGRLFQDGLDGPRTPLGSSPGAAGIGGPASGHGTPDGIVGQHQLGPQPSSSSARSRMWNLFGVDEDQIKDQKAIRQREGGGSGGGGSSSSATGARSSSGPTLNFGSWGRNMRPDVDSEPPTPQSEELRQGRFTSLTSSGSNGQLTAQPLSERLAKSFESRSPRTPAPPIRRESTDPYMIDESERGVQTPTDDGSEAEHDQPGRQARYDQGGANESGMTRARQSDLSSYLPSFLQDVGLVRTPQGSNSPLPQHATLGGANVGSPMPELNDEQAAHATAQIDRAHLDAGVETLKSIFPDVESSVCRLVLEGCSGDVQASIDKLLEMS